jgi:hypothetical protein
MPAHEVAVLLVLRIGDGVEEQLEAGYAADIFGRLLAWAVDVPGIVSGGIGGGGRLDRDFVSPIVAEVVGIGQFRDAPD